MKDILSLQPQPFRRLLLAWYHRHKRDLPWRNTTDPYRIWLSEIMLQQTRVAAVIPYYERFLNRFPDIQALAAAPEQDVLTFWAGLGYYSRARNLQKAAREMVEQGGFPETYDGIRALPGIGDYTAAAIASIAFGQPHAVLDGNVMRVLSRLDNDASDIGAGQTRKHLQQRAQQLLDTRHPAASNQAMMELGATICLPKAPLCLLCPVRTLCAALQNGTERQLPVKGRKQATIYEEKTLLVIRRGTGILMSCRPSASRKLQGFWELPESRQLPLAILGRAAGEFRHSITNHNFRMHVIEARIHRIPHGFRFIDEAEMEKIPVSTETKKALRCFTNKDLL